MRDYFEARLLWEEFLDDDSHNSFFSATPKDWMMENLKSGRMMGAGLLWYVIFCARCWLIWKWRNEQIFTEKVIQRKAVQVRNLASEFYHVFNQISMLVSHRQSAPLLVRWLPPEAGWAKINSDGVLRREDNHIIVGGVVHNCKGEWIKGFVANIGMGYVIAAELWGVFYSLKTCWEFQQKSVWVETNSTLVCSLIQNAFKHTSPHQSLIQAICNMIDQD